jgi:pimeloyl-ACP methyl ester carboxylesterase
MTATSREVGSVTPVPGGLRAEYDRRERLLRRIPLHREAMIVTNGAVSLAGERLWRADAKPRGTIVIVHGSSDSTRAVYGPWVFYLVARGWAVAVYDKRGSGKSTGDWRQGDFSQLASDARAVGRYAHARLPDKPVGMLGVSQAGWVMPLAAKSGGFDFIVSLAGAGGTPAAQTLELIEGQLKAYGLPRPEIDTAMAYYRLDLDVTMGKQPWSAIAAAYRKASAAKAEWLFAPPEPENSGTRAFLRHIASFDPAPYWAKLRIPVLAVFGGKDLIVPAEPNRALVARALAANPGASTVLIPDVNHVGMTARAGTFAEYGTLDRYDPAYFRSFGDWLEGMR